MALPRIFKRLFFLRRQGDGPLSSTEAAMKRAAARQEEESKVDGNPAKPNPSQRTGNQRAGAAKPRSA